MTQRNHLDSLYWLWWNGLRFGGVIDLGCADGSFLLHLAELGPARNCALLNVDAQSDYEPWLAKIHGALGGHYRICAVGERDGGTVTLQPGAHAYWSSLRATGDRYWRAVNDLRAAHTIEVPIRTLDSLVEETALPGPYLLKLDIQGGEAAALAGGPRTLALTDAVVVEIVIEDFAAIHAALDRAGFRLFDLVDLNYSSDHALAWFYAIYLSERHAGLRPVAHWDPRHNEAMLEVQAKRRAMVHSDIAASLERFRAGEWAEVPP
jgi:FkbM family methyltransferase